METSKITNCPVSISNDRWLVLTLLVLKWRRLREEQAEAGPEMSFEYVMHEVLGDIQVEMSSR